LSYPTFGSVNDFIGEKFTSVQYSLFDNVVSIVRNLGKGALIGKKDIKSAFRILPGDFDLLGFKIGSNYYIDKCLPMGCSISCSTFEHFSTFIYWLVSLGHGSQNLDHYLDDFFFAGESNTDNCKRLMKTFDHVCARLVVPIAKEKTGVPMKNA
jgi:hypothetical protein